MMTEGLSKFRRLSVVQMCLFGVALGLLFISYTDYCYADLTFHPIKRIGESISRDLSLYDKREFPRNSGLQVYVHRKPSLTVAESEISSVTVHEVQTPVGGTPDLGKALDMAEKKVGGKIGRSITVVTFRLKEQAATKLGAFGQKHTGETFALKFRSLMIGLPTFLGSFDIPSYDFDVAGLTEEDITRLKKFIPAFRDERKQGSR